MNGWNISRMARRGALIVVALGASILGGCNAGANNLVEANRALTDRNAALTAQNESLNNLNQQLQGELNRRNQMVEELNRHIAALRAGSGDLDARYQSLLAQLGNLRFGDLDPVTDAALRELASQHADILEYDSARGMLRFKSDLTFASGSDQLADSVRGTLATLANILNGAAANYEVRVVGHTDTQRVRQIAGRRFTNNLELSAFRSISVRNELVNRGVSAQRVEIAGRGEFDPLVPNTASGNTPQNRRVEIFLGRAMGAASPTITNVPDRATDAPTRPPVRDEIMK